MRLTPLTLLRERFNPFTPANHLAYRIPKNPDWYAKYNPELKIGDPRPRLVTALTRLQGLTAARRTVCPSTTARYPH